MRQRALAVIGGAASCARCTYSRHPATIILSKPKSWHGKLAYSRAASTMPAIGWHDTTTHGLAPAPSSATTLPPARSRYPLRRR